MHETLDYEDKHPSETATCLRIGHRQPCATSIVSTLVITANYRRGCLPHADDIRALLLDVQPSSDTLLMFSDCKPKPASTF